MCDEFIILSLIFFYSIFSSRLLSIFSQRFHDPDLSSARSLQEGRIYYFFQVADTVYDD